MDIAKIRKKIKEESEKEKSEDKAAGEITSASGGGAKQQRAASEKTEDKKQEAEHRSHKSEVKPQPPEMLGAQAVTESVSKTAQPEDAVSGIIELLTFQLAAEEFAFRISEVEEILTPQQITMVPKAPDYILGITSVRGKVMPVLDLKKRLSINPPIPSLLKGGEGGLSRKKILTLKGPKGRIGIMIDRINGVIRIDESDIAEPPAHLRESDLMFVGGVVLYNGRFISVIRLEEAANINLK